jgi:hypothetical protein
MSATEPNEEGAAREGGPRRVSLLLALERAGDAQRRATAERDRLIREALALGTLSHRQIGQAVGLSHGAVQAIGKRGAP